MNGPYALITTAVSADLGTHPGNKQSGIFVLHNACYLMTGFVDVAS